MNHKKNFEYLELQYVVINDTCKNAEDFADTWYSFLISNGWTEEDFEQELISRMIDDKYIN